METTVVNFVIPKKLQKRIEERIRKEGFASKAEFFRLAAVSYLNLGPEERERKAREELRILGYAIEEQLRRKFKGKKIPSIEEQLTDL